MSEIIFGLGTNLGDRTANLDEAISRLEKAGFKLLAKSSIFETEPWGGIEQPDFLNACVKMEFNGEIKPLEILSTVKSIEEAMGRRKNVRWGARLIDIDILLIGDLRYEDEKLSIPHKELKNRAFVLYPLSEICPEWSELALKFPKPRKYNNEST